MTIRLHIDRLVVDAGLGGDASTIEREVTAALQAALEAGAGWQAATDPQRQVEAPPGATLGVRIGAAVHAAITSDGQAR